MDCDRDVPPRDIDFGIAVESWAQFELLKQRLLATNDFSASRAQQRLTFTDSNEGISIPVDLIPFRGVASADGTIAWPPGRDIVMNVAGFEEALTSSVLIEIEADQGRSDGARGIGSRTDFA